MKSLVIIFPSEVSASQESNLIGAIRNAIISINAEMLNGVEVCTFSVEEVSKMLIEKSLKVVKPDPLVDETKDFIRDIRIQIGCSDQNPNEFAKEFVKLAIRNERIRNEKLLRILKDVRKYPNVQVVLENEHFEKFPAILRDVWSALNWLF